MSGNRAVSEWEERPFWRVGGERRYRRRFEHFCGWGRLFRQGLRPAFVGRGREDFLVVASNPVLELPSRLPSSPRARTSPVPLPLPSSRAARAGGERCLAPLHRRKRRPNFLLARHDRQDGYVDPSTPIHRRRAYAPAPRPCSLYPPSHRQRIRRRGTLEPSRRQLAHQVDPRRRAFLTRSKRRRPHDLLRRRGCMSPALPDAGDGIAPPQSSAHRLPPPSRPLRRTSLQISQRR